MEEKKFSEDCAFLKHHVETVVLTNDEGAAIAVVPQYQGRTMTSTSQLEGGQSYGYLNYDHIAATEPRKQINLYGGEDRVWISPEGGQYSIFFDPQVDMTFDNWRTPPELDTHAFEVEAQADQSIQLSKLATFTNWSGTRFDTKIQRSVHLLDRNQAEQHLGTSVEGVRLCSHESHNTLTNVGQTAWEASTGLIGIWMLCMSKPSPSATLIAPFQSNENEDLDGVASPDIVNADYFGKLGEDRLKIDRQSKLIFFKGDGRHRSKLGLTFDRVTSRLGSWDANRGVLSIVEFNLPPEVSNGYNNNLWEMQDEPYAGDVINCYNDGLNESGSSLGKGGFYELETISPALALAPQASYTHIHRTIRMESAEDVGQGRSSLSRIAQHVFGVGLDEIERQFG